MYTLIHGNINFLLNGWWTNPGMTEAIGLPLTFLSGLSHVLFAGAGKYSLNLFNDVLASRLPIVLIGSLVPVFMYFFGSEIFSRKLSLISALIYIFNPIAISLDRWVSSQLLFEFFLFFVLDYVHLFLKEREDKYFSGAIPFDGFPDQTEWNTANRLLDTLLAINKQVQIFGQIVVGKCNDFRSCGYRPVAIVLESSCLVGDRILNPSI